MSRTVLACLLSAVLGSLAAVGWSSRSNSRLATAEEPGLFPPRSAAPGTTPPGPTKGPTGGPRFTAPPTVGQSPRAVDRLASTSAPLELEEGLTPDERVNILVYEKVNRSVVNINTRGVRIDFFVVGVPSEGSGSGMLIDRQGRVLTNYHVVEDAREIQVTLYDGSTSLAKLVGADPVNDVAVLQLESPPETIYPVEFGDSTRLRVGQRAFAIGNPFGLERTLTTGVISSLNRSLPNRNRRTIKSIIQIDAAINPGNSGGPLLDSRGRLIGINTAIASRTGQSSGVGFAIPVSTVARVIPQLVQRGRVVRPEVGISRVYQIEKNDIKGLLIARLLPGGPAERAGLRGPRLVKQRRGPFTVESLDVSAADLILAVDDKPTPTADEFLDLVESKQPGEQLVVTILREGKEVRVALTLAADE